MSNLLYGVISLVHHIPLMLLTSFTSLLLAVNFPALGDLAWPLLLPLLLSPAWCLWGVVRGIRRRGERHGIACAVMSAIGLVLFMLMMWAAVYFGSRY